MYRNLTKTGTTISQLLLAFAIVSCLNGCRLFDRDGRGGGGWFGGSGSGTGTGRIKDGGTGNRHGADVASNSSNIDDPLFGKGKYIPKQDIPIPGRNGELAIDRDPLLRGSTSSASNERKEPFRLGPENTTAALAGTPRDDVPALNDRRTGRENPNAVPFTRDNLPAVNNNGAKPVEGALSASIQSKEGILDELRRMNVRLSEPLMDNNGDYVVSGEVVYSNDLPTRRFEGAGKTPASALAQLYEQIKSSR